MQTGDAVAFAIDGIPYFLTSANLYPFIVQCGNMDVKDQAVITGGNLVGPPGYNNVWDFFNSTNAEINIINPNGIDSATAAFVGRIVPNGTSGAWISFYFGSIHISNDGPVCPGDSLQLWGDTTITEPGSFLWSGPNGFSSTEQNPVIYPLTPPDTGLYTLTYVTGTDTFTDTTRVTTLPGPAIPYITADSPVCAGGTMHLSAAATPGAIYSWIGPNGFSASSPEIVVPDVQDENNGIYKVIASMDGCSPSAEIEVNVTHPVSYDFTEVACSSSGYDFNGKLKYESGVYTDTFAGSNGCDSFSNLHLVIVPAPEVHIDLPWEEMHCMGDTVQLTTEGNARNYTWYGSAGNILGTDNKLFFPLLYLSNKIILTGISDNDCRDSAEMTITADRCCRLFIPNAFSPNGNGLNDHFGPSTNGHIKAYQLSIYNRYGQRIFFSSDIQNRWDGTINNTPADAGTYYYYITAECMEGTELKQKGDITLLR